MLWIWSVLGHFFEQRLFVRKWKTVHVNSTLRCMIDNPHMYIPNLASDRARHFQRSCTFHKEN